MSRLLSFIIITILTCTLAVVSCSPPIGNIGGGGTSAPGNGDHIWAVPYRDAYDITDLFIRSSDLSVLMSARGLVHNIPVSAVTISVIEDPDWNSNGGVLVPPDEHYTFKSAGRKVIVVEYNGLTARYSVMVNDPYGFGENPGNGNGNGDNGSIVINWGCDKHGLNPCVFCCSNCGKFKDDCYCPCKACGRKPCLCCPVCKLPPPDVCPCGIVGPKCTCPCPDCEQNPCICTCAECGKLLADCICCHYCEKLVCICPSCKECGKEPCHCPCTICWRYPCVCCWFCGLNPEYCNRADCAYPGCDCPCPNCKQTPCICCPVCERDPVGCKCNCKDPDCICPCTECGRIQCVCCSHCHKFICICCPICGELLSECKGVCDECIHHPCVCCKECGHYFCICPPE